MRTLEISYKDRIWGTKDEKLIHVERMTLDHIRNCIDLLEREIEKQKFKRHTCDTESPCIGCDNHNRIIEKKENWIHVFEVELLRRGEVVD